MLAQTFGRMDPEVVLSLENVSPQLRALSFELAGREVPRISAAPYGLVMLREFGYSVSTNGLGFAAVRTGVFLERRTRQDQRSAEYMA